MRSQPFTVFIEKAKLKFVVEYFDWLQSHFINFQTVDGMRNRQPQSSTYQKKYMLVIFYRIYFNLLEEKIIFVKMRSQLLPPLI